MSNLELIFRKCKDAHYKPWRGEDITVCKAMMQELSHEELRLLSTSRWMSRLNPLYNTLFELLYKEELSNVVEQLNNSTVDELLNIMKNTASKFRKQKIGEILYQRYETMNDEERKKVYRHLVRKGFIVGGAQ